MAWRRWEPQTALLGAAMVASGVLLLVLQWNLTFFQDTWAFLLERQGSSVGDFLRPHNEHLVLLPVAINKLCVTLFGMINPRPEAVVMTVSLCAAAGALFVYVRRRTEAWLGLMAACLVLFLGSTWMIIIWPFEIVFSGGILCAVWMLLALERDDERGDAWACLLLTLSIAFGSVGLCFVPAAALDVFFKRRRRGLRRSYLVAVPVLLYLAWFAGWGHTAEHHLTLHNVLVSPQYVFDGLASSIACLLGLATGVNSGLAEIEWGRVLLIAFLAGAVVLKSRRPGFSDRFWLVVSATLAYWVLAAFNYIPGREAYATRYAYVGAFLVIMLAAELLEGLRLGRRGLWVAGALTVLAIGPNLAQLKEGADVLKEQSLLARSAVTGLEISRRTVPPEMPMTPEVTGTLSTVEIVPKLYFEAVDGHGSPAYTPAELAGAPENGRRWADVLLSKALPLSLSSGGGPVGATSLGACVKLAGEGGSGRQEVAVGPGVVRISVAGPPEPLVARRFAQEEFPVQLGSVGGGAAAVLRIPRDNASQPWYLHLQGAQGGTVCR